MRQKLFVTVLIFSLFCGCNRSDPRKIQIFNSLKVTAASGDHQAERNVGFCYLKGFGVTEDHAEAVAWFKKAADGGALKGDILAIELLGSCYITGDGVSVNLTEAFRLTTMAAERGEVLAAENLGHLYSEGKGVEKNRPEAWKWYNFAARSENAAIFPGLAERTAKERDELATKMSREEIAEGEAKALVFATELLRRSTGPYDGLEWPPK